MRPSKIIRAALVDRIVAAVEQGCTYAAAASAAPIAESTLHEWLRRGERDEIVGHDSPYAQFRQRVETATSPLSAR